MRTSEIYNRQQLIVLGTLIVAVAIVCCCCDRWGVPGGSIGRHGAVQNDIDEAVTSMMNYSGPDRITPEHGPEGVEALLDKYQDRLGMLTEQLLLYRAEHMAEEERFMTAMFVWVRIRATGDQLELATVLLPLLSSERDGVGLLAHRDLEGIIGMHVDQTETRHRESKELVFARKLLASVDGSNRKALLAFLYDQFGARRLPSRVLALACDVYLSGEERIETRETGYRIDDYLWKEMWITPLSERGPLDPEIREELEALLASEHWWIRYYVGEVLRGYPPLRREFLETLAQDRDPMVRSLAQEMARP
jgi:hypothetical protein